MRTIRNKLTGETMQPGEFNPVNGILSVFKTFGTCFDIDIILTARDTGNVEEHWTNHTDQPEGDSND